MMDLSLSSASPEYAAILAKLSKLRAREIEIIEVVRDPALRGLRARDPQLLDRQRRELSPPAANDSVAALIGDLAPPPPTEARFEDEHAIVQRLGNELVVVRQAMDLLEKKERECRLVASRALCAQIRPEFNRLAKAVATAASDLSIALVSYNALTAGLRREGAAWAALGALDSADDLAREHGPVARLLKSAAESGHIAARASRKVA